MSDEAPQGFVPATLHFSRAGNRTRTGDPNLGKVVLYQLSYSRNVESKLGVPPEAVNQQHTAAERYLTPPEALMFGR